ncbi:hypothetical protein GYA54_01315 [Candidatus Kuenenbacteria bacterium]|nr:hypothetical protein [Candidatus Kuenenbacteria bacterium]
MNRHENPTLEKATGVIEAEENNSPDNLARQLSEIRRKQIELLEKIDNTETLDGQPNQESIEMMEELNRAAEEIMRKPGVAEIIMAEASGEKAYRDHAEAWNKAHPQSKLGRLFNFASYINPNDEGLINSWSESARKEYIDEQKEKNTRTE